MNNFILGNKAHKHTDTQRDREADIQTHLQTTSYNRQEPKDVRLNRLYKSFFERTKIITLSFHFTVYNP